MAGGVEFDRGKFEELIVYIATRLPPEAALGRVKLAKLLTSIDFTSYARLGRSMTGATYEKWEHGHLPRELLIAQRDLEAHGAITTEPVEYFGKTLKHVAAQRDPDLRDFEEDELAIVEGVLKLYGHESANYLRELAHREIGWRVADEHEEIPYDSVFLERPTADDLAHASALAERQGWD